MTAIQASFGIGEKPCNGLLFPDHNLEATREPLIDQEQLKARLERKKALEQGQRELPEMVCPECGFPRPDDDRVQNGMKCSLCAYGD